MGFDFSKVISLSPTNLVYVLLAPKVHLF